MHDPRFIFLGTGTSGGVPIIACTCEVCTSDDPRDTRTRTGACITWTDGRGIERVVLIDATPDLREQALRHGLMRCDAIVFTHNHVDHIFGLDEVRRFNAVMKAPIDIYAEEHTMASIHRIYKHIFDRASNVNESFVAHLIAHRLDPDAPLDLYGMRFTPVRLLHGKLPILGFRIEPIPAPPTPAPGSAPGNASRPAMNAPFPMAYCTDVSGIPPESWRLLGNLDTLVLDGLRIRRHPTHFNLDQATKVAMEVSARQTWFTHIAHEVLHAREDPALPEGVNLAWDGLVLGGGGDGSGPGAEGGAAPDRPSHG